jgi:hypothetical protein
MRLSLPPTPQHEHSRRSGQDSIRTKPDLSRPIIFGCRVCVKPPHPHRPAKPEIDAPTGIFLGYVQTLKNLLYFDLDSHKVKSAQHARYDEGTKDVADPAPITRLVRFAGRGEPFPTEVALLEALDIDASLCACPSSAKIRTLDL